MYVVDTQKNYLYKSTQNHMFKPMDNKIFTILCLIIQLIWTYTTQPLIRITLKNSGARQFVENHFADTTIGRTRLLVDATFRQVRHLVEKKWTGTTFGRNCQVVVFRPNVVLDGTSHLPNVIGYLKKNIIRNHFVYPTCNL